MLLKFIYTQFSVCCACSLFCALLECYFSSYNGDPPQVSCTQLIISTQFSQHLILLISGNTQENRATLIYLEKQDHSQTVIVVVACGRQLTVSMFEQEETKTQQIEVNRMKASEYQNTKTLNKVKQLVEC